MKKASTVLYSIGFIFNIIGLALYIGALVFLGISYGSAEIIAKIAEESQRTVGYVQLAILTAIIVIAIVAFLTILCIVLACIARDSLRKKKGGIFIHVLMLIAGVLSTDIFYFVGSIFGLVAVGQDNAEELDD